MKKKAVTPDLTNDQLGELLICEIYTSLKAHFGDQTSTEIIKAIFTSIVSACVHVSGVVTTVFTTLLILRTHKETFTGIGRLFNMYWDYLGFITNSILFFLIGILVFSLFLLQSGALWILTIVALL